MIWGTWIRELGRLTILMLFAVGSALTRSRPEVGQPNWIAVVLSLLAGHS
jgi:hypothetical protein